MVVSNKTRFYNKVEDRTTQLDVGQADKLKIDIHFQNNFSLPCIDFYIFSMEFWEFWVPNHCPWQCVVKTKEFIRKLFLGAENSNFGLEKLDFECENLYFEGENSDFEGENFDVEKEKFYLG